MKVYNTLIVWNAVKQRRNNMPGFDEGQPPKDQYAAQICMSPATAIDKFALLMMQKGLIEGG